MTIFQLKGRALLWWKMLLPQLNMAFEEVSWELFEEWFQERTRAFGSVRPTTMRDFGKDHRIHAVLNNRQEEHQSTIFETSGIVTDHTLSILIDPSATEIFISGGSAKEN
jgi:hypothetical protein